ncbi:MAG: 50S ribosomal protein L9 [Alphaproteobacteria bacterium CG_4_10_14_0_8_um_filter_53_9]|nr:MAG: 50S ribosomal protein L9 [Alphaproteobacteria bacterium CG_4_10_14_0_8_um_filter_53_9]
MSNMNVILVESVQGVGSVGQEVAVKAGFARNFLLPREKAVIANAANRAKVDADRKELEAKNAEAKKAAEKESAKYKDLTVVMQKLSSETGQLYGSIKARDIATELAAKNLTVDAGHILIGSPIRTVDEHIVKVVLHPEVIVSVKVIVERQSNQ